MGIALLLAIILVGLGYAENEPVSFAEASRVWRQNKSNLLIEYRAVSGRSKYYQEVISYFRDGPGLFNVAPNMEYAALDRILHAAIQEIGYECVELEIWMMGLALDTGQEDQVRLAEKLSRERFAARLIRGSKITLEKFKNGEINQEQQALLDEGIRLALKKIQEHRKWRAEKAAEWGLMPDNSRNQEALLEHGVKLIEDYLQSRKDQTPDPGQP
jgi:hypothetical protein